MLTLTRLLHRQITLDGRPLGRPSEVIAARSGGAAPVVTALVVHGERVPWPSSGVVAGGDDVHLVRDVLDVQVLDRQGRHRGRVGDVELEEQDDGTLRVVAVETGLRPVLARLRLLFLAGRATSQRIPWEELHPLAGRAHAFTAELPQRRPSYHGVMRARRRPPR